jgi:FixJ family two-component response regulator
MAELSRSVAIVDDDPPVLRALRRLLRGRGFDARTYESAHEFLAALPQEQPDCLIVDFQMPQMTGLELHEHLTRRGIRIPTIVISAIGGDEVGERCVAAGAVAFLAKPIENPTLFAAINKAIARSSHGGHPG